MKIVLISFCIFLIITLSCKDSSPSELTDSSVVQEQQCPSDGDDNKVAPRVPEASISQSQSSSQVRSQSRSNGSSILKDNTDERNTNNTFKIEDVEPPVILCDNHPSSLKATKETSVIFNWYMFDIDSGVKNSQCKFDRKFEDCASPVKLDNLRPGHHAFTIKAFDNAGNFNTKVFDWRVEREVRLTKEVKEGD